MGIIIENILHTTTETGSLLINKNDYRSKSYPCNQLYVLHFILFSTVYRYGIEDCVI